MDQNYEVLGLFGSLITLTAWREDDQTVVFRGSKSRKHFFLRLEVFKVYHLKADVQGILKMW